MLLKAFLMVGTLGAFMSVGIAWSVLRVEYPTFLLITSAVDFLPIHQLQESLALIVVLAWTMAVQIPTHLRLDKSGFERELLARMVRNEWVRFLAVIVQALGYSALLLTNL